MTRCSQDGTVVRRSPFRKGAGARQSTRRVVRRSGWNVSLSFQPQDPVAPGVDVSDLPPARRPARSPGDGILPIPRARPRRTPGRAGYSLPTSASLLTVQPYSTRPAAEKSLTNPWSSSARTMLPVEPLTVNLQAMIWSKVRAPALPLTFTSPTRGPLGASTRVAQPVARPRAAVTELQRRSARQGERVTRRAVEAEGLHRNEGDLP